jgi:hypothetical protein
MPSWFGRRRRTNKDNNPGHLPAVTGPPAYVHHALANRPVYVQQPVHAQQSVYGQPPVYARQPIHDQQPHGLYQQLDPEKSQIRVLSFAPNHGPGDGSLALAMHTISLDDPHRPSFNALSYVWGPPVFDARAIINGFPMGITRNLSLALHDFRSAADSGDGGVSYWWADAVCINQADPVERGSQVRLMSRIYLEASRTTAHLGDELPSAGLALSFLDELATRRRQPNATQFMLQAVADPRYADQWKALDVLLNARYWTRAWILQETTLSARVEIFNPLGPWLDMDRMLDGMFFIFLLKQYIQQPLQDAVGVYLGHRFSDLHSQLGLRRTFRPDETAVVPLPFVKALLPALRLEASDPRDHLYAVLAISSDGLDIVGTPDYVSPPAHVFADFVRSSAAVYGTLDMMLLNNRPRRLPSVPSWVPDLGSFQGDDHTGSLVQENLKSVSVPKGTAPSAATMRYKAGGLGPTNASFSPDLRVLTVGGVRLGMISGLGGWLSMTKENGRGIVGDANPCEQLQHSNVLGDPSLIERTQILDSVAMAILHGIIPTIQGPLPSGIASEILASSIQASDEGTLSSPYQFGLANWWQLNKDVRLSGRPLSEWIFGGGGRPEMSAPERSQALVKRLEQAKLEVSHELLSTPADQIPNSYLSRLSHVTIEMQRRMLVTEQGLVGMAPSHCKLGDEVWVLDGCCIPAVLRRPVAGAEGQWELVCEAWMQGLMSGEALGSGVQFRQCVIV